MYCTVYCTDGNHCWDTTVWTELYLYDWQMIEVLLVTEQKLEIKYCFNLLTAVLPFRNVSVIHVLTIVICVNYFTMVQNITYFIKHNV